MNAFDNPASLREALRRVAGNLWFTWLPGARALFEQLDPERFAALAHNPTALLAELSDQELAARATTVYQERVDRVLREVDEEEHRANVVGAPGGGRPVRRRLLLVRVRARREPPDLLGRPRRPRRRPPEVGLRPRPAARRPSGSSTARATSASSSTRATGRHERYPENDPAAAAARRSRRSRPVVELADESGELVPVSVQVWRVDVGRIPLYLLDTDVERQPDRARAITDRLYGGDREHRAAPGARARRRRRPHPARARPRPDRLPHERGPLGVPRSSSACASSSRTRSSTRDAALQRLRASTVFTTHTPVPAGNEVFDARARRAERRSSRRALRLRRGTSSSRSAA